MNDRQKAKLSMYQEVAKVCRANEQVYAVSLARLDSTLYDRLNRLVMLFKTSAPDFYALYRNVRNIIDTAKRSRKPDENKA